MKKIKLTPEELDKVIKLKESGTSWLKIEHETGISRRTAKHAYEKWKHSQSPEVLREARKDVAAKAFLDHLKSLTTLAGSLVTNLSVSSSPDMMTNAEQFFVWLWQQNLLWRGVLSPETQERYNLSQLHVYTMGGQQCFLMGDPQFNILENELNYKVYYEILNAKYYGVPQNRPRIFIVGFKEPIRFDFPLPSSIIPKLKTVLEKNVLSKYYLSQRYLDGLKNHRRRHEKLGHGFGYMVLDPDGVAKTLVIGGMGHERNLVKNTPTSDAYRGPRDDLGKPNKEGLRRLTPRECARLQGYADSFKFPVSNTQAYRQLAESVAVPLIRRIALSMKKAIEERILIL